MRNIICGSCVELDRVIKRHLHFPWLLFTSHHHCIESLQTFDATLFVFASRHEILATGCIQALPKASNLFHEEAYRVAFFFVLVVEFGFAAFELFLLVVDDPLAFEAACPLEGCAEP